MARINTFIKRKSKEYWQIIKQEFYAESAWSYIKNISLTILGSCLVAFAACLFYFPLSIVSGGVSGLVIVFDHFCGLGEEVWNLILTWGLFVFGLITLGFRFSIKTLIATIVYPAFVFVFKYLAQFDLLDITKYLIDTGTLHESLTEFQVTATNLGVYLIGGVFGGAITGLGVALTFVGGGSSGGVDCLILFLQKYFRIKASISSLILDTVIIFAGFFVTQDIMRILVGIIASILCSFLIDKVFLGGTKQYVAFIVTNNYAVLSKEINYKLERGTTLLKSVGGFSGKKGYTVQVCFDRKDYKDLIAIVNRCDKRAFMTVVKADEITGYGFSKRKIKKKYLKVNPFKKKDIVPLEEITPMTKEELLIEDLRINNLKKEKRKKKKKKGKN